MARQSILQRQLKREKLVDKYKEKRSQLLKQFSSAENLRNKLIIHKKIEKLPRNSVKVRSRNRCWRTGRGRGIYRDFGLCRHMIKEMAHNGLLPGVYKASW
jgi:small subunit ribosomal protein S14